MMGTMFAWLNSGDRHPLHLGSGLMECQMGGRKKLKTLTTLVIGACRRQRSASHHFLH